jgi:arginyl-tRNA--protein-N-Asp/Glu arginylyltransferase
VPVATFAPSKNQRRVLARARQIRVEVGVPRVDDLRLALYRRWHARREGDRGWKPDSLDAKSYEMQFAFPHPAAREYSYWLDGALIGIGIMDDLPGSLSAVYCYYEPAHAALSLGTVNVLTALRRASEAGKRYVYLGYRVEDCASLSYKGRFVPQERLAGRPETGEEPRWMPE